MKLRIMGFEEIDFNDQDNTILVIKRHRFYAHILNLLSSILYDKNKSTELLIVDGEKNITTNVLLITDLYKIDFNDKNLLKEIYAQISKSITSDEEKCLRYQRLVDDLSAMLEDELKDYNLEFDYKNDLTIENYLKAVSLKISRKAEEKLYDRLMNYVELVTELVKKPVLVLYNCLDYLDDEELMELIKYKNYKHLHLLFIENSDREVESITFRKYIIDEDLCEDYDKIEEVQSD